MFFQKKCWPSLAFNKTSPDPPPFQWWLTKVRPSPPYYIVCSKGNVPCRRNLRTNAKCLNINIFSNGQLFTEVEVNSGELIYTAFTDTEVDNCFSIYHTSWITSAPKSNFICDKKPTKAILFFFGCSEVNSTVTWLITSKLSQSARAKSTILWCGKY